MTYWVVAVHVLAALYALQAVCAEIGGRRSPHPDRVIALRVATGAACVVLVLAVAADVLGPARLWWEFAMIACVFVVALSVRILKGDGPR